MGGRLCYEARMPKARNKARVAPRGGGREAESRTVPSASRTFSGRPKVSQGPRDDTPGAVVISESAAAAVVRGHPWVWRDAVQRTGAELPLGEVVQIRQGGRALGQGMWDPTS